jgi:hypothetical protein
MNEKHWSGWTNAVYFIIFCWKHKHSFKFSELKLRKEHWMQFREEVLGRSSRLLSFETAHTAEETTPLIFLRCRGSIFTELLPSNDRGIHWQTQRHTRSTILLLLRVFTSEGRYLASCCLAMKGGIHFTEPLPSNDRGCTYRHTDWWEGFVKYAVELSWGPVITYQVS